MKKRIRIQQIIIDIPKEGSEPWINVAIQLLEIDDEGMVLNTVHKWQTVNKKLSDVYGSKSTYSDPYFSKIDEPISTAGVADGITKMVRQWIADKFDSVVDSDGYIFI